jgi:mRNA interferase MazF
VRRGEIYIADLPDPVGRRPVLLVTRTAAIEVRSSVTVAPITRTRRHIASEVPLDRIHGVRQRSVASCDSLMTIRKESLRPRRVGALDVASLVALDQALRYALDIRT